MNIIGQDLNLTMISEEYFKLLNPTHELNGENRPQRHIMHYPNNESANYQKAYSVIAKLDLEIKKNNTISKDFKRLLTIILDKKKKHELLKNLICGKSNELRKYIRQIENFKKRYKINFSEHINGKIELTEEGKAIVSIFDYTGLALPQNTWIGNQLKIKACPYCNAQYTVALEDSAKFQLDHFFPQSEYPYLALSFFNLIPCCANCNLKKKAKDTYKNFPLIHPYEKSFHEIVKFETNEKIIEDFIKTGKFNSVDFKIKLSTKKSGFDEIIGNHKEIFEIEEKANVHKDVVSELYMKAYIYNDSMKTELVNSFKVSIGKDKEDTLSLFTDDEIDRIVFGNYTNEKDFHKRPLSKLTRDIAEELGLI
jgi:hypothetical protein